LRRARIEENPVSLMLFNSYGFIFLFLPVVLLGFFQLGRISHSYAAAWLMLASLFFYGYWNPAYVGLLLGSIAFNYIFGMWIARAGTAHLFLRKKHLLVIAIAANLALLAYYKYTNFFISNLNPVLGTSWNFGNIILPLGISFFTFTQIAFLVDAYQEKVKEYNFIHYALFVTYFPHLIAGPVLHHKEMMPQFAKPASYHINWENISVGLTIFVLGLAKKVLIADQLNEFATPIFNAIAAGGHPMLFEAWIGALAYTLQLYFDFSGYSDMAIGLSLMFNVRLPINFNSPYKSKNIIEFWRRWHMTLSRFLRDYLYIPLGGNRKGKFSRYQNLMITMLLGGLWHGAGWTFLIWGGLHGIYLVINNGWIAFKQRMNWTGTTFAAGTITFISVVVGWVFFRAANFTSAIDMLRGMAGLNGVSMKYANTELALTLKSYGVQHIGLMPLTDLNPGNALNIIILGMIIVFKMPNLQQIMANYRAAINSPDTLAEKRKILAWHPTSISALFVLLTGYFVIINLHKQSTFLYFQF
jgi:D-alanyl-lipoteichoic acid acyltransferase DltB (MBOAT superfamily)